MTSKTYDLDEQANALSAFITEMSKRFMSEPVLLTVVEGQDQYALGWVWCKRENQRVRCRVPGHMDLTGAAGGTDRYVLLALPPNGPGQDYIALWPAFNGVDAARLPRVRGMRFSNLSGKGINIPRNSANVTNPPTKAELETAFGAVGTVGDGFLALLDDNNANANVYLVGSNGTDFWYVALTKAT